MQKIIFITGGVCSSLGKGIAASSIGMLLKLYGYNITMQKLDPYLNISAGNMSPFQHGEVFVTKDGFETDLDIGNYERFTDNNYTKDNSITTGQIYLEIIKKQEKMEYNGQTIQVIPHVVDEIKKRIYDISKGNDFTIVEIGGTVGDIESIPFIEAIRQIGIERNRKNKNVLFIHLCPLVKMNGEYKTKPTQNSIRQLREMGITPDLLLIRSDKTLQREIREKLFSLTGINKDNIFCAKDISYSIYEIPIDYDNQEMIERITNELKIKDVIIKDKEKFDLLKKIVKKISHIKRLKRRIRIGIVGKYTNLKDSYKSLYEALENSCIYNNINYSITLINADEIDIYNVKTKLEKLNGIVIAGGFGIRGFEGKMECIKYARIHNIPCLGICLGFQYMIIEYVRNVMGLSNANTSEILENTELPIIIKNKDNEMKLGEYTTIFDNDCKVYDMYKKAKIEQIYDYKGIEERHRHRYGFNPIYKDLFNGESNVIFSGRSFNDEIDVFELKNHKWFIGVQFHPEFESKIWKGHPIFNDFIENCIEI